MSARDDILRFKHDIHAMQKNYAISPTILADALFENYVEYAKENWDYAAHAGGLKFETLLTGTGHQTVACGTLKSALKTMFKEDLGREDAIDASLNERFISKPDLHCFDEKVTGNMRNRGSWNFNSGCCFSSHHFVQCCDQLEAEQAFQVTPLMVSSGSRISERYAGRTN